MVARLASSALILYLMFAVFAGFVQAGNTPLDGHASATENRIASEQLAKSTHHLQKRMEKCRKREKKIPAKKFDDVRLNDDQLRLALEYLSLRANNDCIARAAGRFVIAAIVARHPHPEPGGEISPTKSPKVEDLVLHSVRKEIKLAARFRQLPHKGRDDLRSIDGLWKPFDPIASAKSAGLF